MALAEFLRSYPELATKGGESDAEGTGAADPTVLSVIALSIDDDAVVFGHYGIRFRVAPADVVNLEKTTVAIPNPFGIGVPARLTLKPDAVIERRERLSAQSLTSGMPFAVARPSMVNYSLQSRHTPAEEAWLRGLPGHSSPLTTATASQSSTQSPKWSMTQCNTTSDGMIDDFNNDDGQSDEYYSDDSNVDDYPTDDQ